MKCFTVITCLIAFAAAQNLRRLDLATGDDEKAYYSSGGNTQDNNLPQYSQTTMEPPKGKMRIYGNEGPVEYEPVYTAEQQKRLGVDKYGNVVETFGGGGGGYDPLNP